MRIWRYIFSLSLSLLSLVRLYLLLLFVAVSGIQARGAIQLVIERLDSLSTGYLSRVLDLLVADIRYSCLAFDVLETSLSMIVHSSANFAVDVDGDEVEMSGQEYRYGWPVLSWAVLHA